MGKKVYNLIIVDESGSMSIIERQALAGMNETLQTIQKIQEQHKGLEQRVTLITFDSQHCKLHYDNTPAEQASPLNKNAYCPCAATPLYDAIGLGISKINAISTIDDNVLVTIITDGEENCSKEYDFTMINNLITKLKKQKWMFTFIGTDNIDVETISKDLGIDSCLPFTEDEASTTKMFKHEAKCRENYNMKLAKNDEMEPDKYFTTK